MEIFRFCLHYSFFLQCELIPSALVQRDMIDALPIWNHFKQQRDGYVKRLNGIYKSNVEKAGIEYFTGTASFKSAKEIETSEGALLEAEHIVIASGSTPSTLVFPGAEYCLSSDDVFSLEELPKSIVVLGGGYIGVEMA